jgi:hypothetical protein
LLGGSGGDAFVSIKQTTDGGYIAAGYTATSNDGTLTGITNNGGIDGWIVKLDAAGATTWQRLLGGINDDLLPGIQQTADGGYIVAGYTASSNTGTLVGLTNHGGNDGWLLKLNSAGLVQSQSLFGGSTHDYFQGISQTSDGGYITSGYSYSSNTGTLTGITSNGGSDGWVMKLSQFTLPITMIDFTAEKINNNSSQLEWKTAIEVNNDHFEVERSTENSNFILIGKVSGSGTSSLVRNYSFIDNAPKLNGINYYRLKQVDKDGKFSYSKVVTLSFSNAPSVQVFPNPAKDAVFINLRGATGNYNIRLMDAAGKVLSAKTYSSAETTIRFSLSNYSPGIYFIEIKDAFNNSIASQKIIKE